MLLNNKTWPKIGQNSMLCLFWTEGQKKPWLKPSAGARSWPYLLVNSKISSKNRCLCREITIKILYHFCEIQETKRFLSKGMLSID